MEPAASELSLSATERVEQERAELDRHGPQRRERAAYEVEHASSMSPCTALVVWADEAEQERLRQYHQRAIERTFSWLGQNRRLSKDYEQHCESKEAWIYIAMTRLMTKRLAAA